MILNDQITNFIKMYQLAETDFCDLTVTQLKESTDWTIEEGVETCYLYNSEVERLITESLKDIIQNYIDSGCWPWFTGFHTYTSVRFQRFQKNKKMDIRCDHNRFINNNNYGMPILTIIGLLNDDFTKGNFMMIGEKLKFAKGQLLIFPSNFLYPHAIEKVTDGTRYQFISWVY